MIPFPVGDPIACGYYAGGAVNGDKIQTVKGCIAIKEGNGTVSLQLDAPNAATPNEDLVCLATLNVGGIGSTARTIVFGARSFSVANDFTILTRDLADVAQDAAFHFAIWKTPKLR